LGIETPVKPVTNIDLYSEYKTGVFEPREDVKGDIARAMFYFWTIYRDDAVEADPLFFDLMKDNLCLWHEEDPVDPFEILRTQRIATYQDGKENPFILDCSLVKRAYCPNLEECIMVANETVPDLKERILFDAKEHILVIAGETEAEWTVEIFDISGKKIFVGKTESNQKLYVPSFYPGIYLIRATSGSHRLFGKQVYLFP